MTTFTNHGRVQRARGRSHRTRSRNNTARSRKWQTLARKRGTHRWSALVSATSYSTESTLSRPKAQQLGEKRRFTEVYIKAIRARAAAHQGVGFALCDTLVLLGCHRAAQASMAVTGSTTDVLL
eukprot:SAG25_NODE_252_length_10970_cov_6.386349_9_plen_124_part_00